MVMKTYVKAKQNATTAVDGLTSLNEAQRDQLKQQIAQAQTLPDVDTTKTKQRLSMMQCIH